MSLEIIFCKDTNKKWELILKESFKDCSYVVSDIKSKALIESHLLQRDNQLIGNKVVRSQELFYELFKKIYPEWQILSASFLQKFFLTFAQAHKLPWVRNLSSSTDFFQYFNLFLPILSHPESPSLIEEWINQKNNTAKKRWKHWYELSQDFFSILKQKKWLHKEGIQGLLLNGLSSQHSTSWLPQKLIFDLGVNFDSCEQEIIQTISKNKDVVLLIPYLEKEFYGKKYISPYETVLNQLSSTKPPKSLKDKKTNQPKLIFNKYKTSLQEVKFITAQVRQWIEQGIPQDNIVLLAPRIEYFWPTLKPHLEKENIYFKKSLASLPINYPEVVSWLSSIKIQLGLSDFSHLEISEFSESKYKMLFNEFQNMFYNFPQKKYENSFIKSSTKKSLDDLVSGKDFINWILKLWPRHGRLDILDPILDNFKKANLSVELKYRHWFLFLEEALFSQELEVESENKKGISCLSFNALQSVQASHVIVMGLSEESMKTKDWTSVTTQDWDSLIRELGFPLAFDHPYTHQISLQWFLQNNHIQQAHLSYSEESFTGEVQTPSPFFLLSYQKHPLPDYMTSWESCKQQASLDQILTCLDYKPRQVGQIKQALVQDRDDQFVNIFPAKDINKISISGLGLYCECPFKYLVQHIFKIPRPDLLGMDFSALEYGSKAHELLEYLMKNKYLDISDAELKKYISQLKFNETCFTHPSQKDHVHTRLYDLAKLFLEEEKRKQNENSTLKFYSAEHKFDCYWNEKEKSLSQQGEVRFSGKIDRIDQDTKNQAFAVLDYKTGKGEKTHLASWVKNNEFQLILYAQAIEKGLVEGIPPEEVQALVYYSVKQTKYKGYVQKSPDLKKVFPGTGIQKERSVFLQFQNDLNEKISEIIFNIKKGRFQPEPQNKQNCERCDWRNWCRASHLN